MKLLYSYVLPVAALLLQPLMLLALLAGWQPLAVRYSELNMWGLQLPLLLPYAHMMVSQVS